MNHLGLQLILDGVACIIFNKITLGYEVNFRSNVNYLSMSDKELVDRAEQGELHINPDFYAEFMRRMEVHGTSYSNSPEDVERWKADIALSAKKGLSRATQVGAAELRRSYVDRRNKD